MLSSKSLTATLVGVLLCVTGLSNAGAQAPTPQSIDNPPPLEPAPVPGAYRWQKPGFNLKSYDKLMVEPPVFVIHDGSEEKAIKPEQLQVTGQALRSHVVHAMEPTYPVVDRPGQGVLLIRPALTNLKLKKEKRAMRGVFGIMPAGIAINTIQAAAGRSLELKEAMFEAEMVDSVSGERLMVAVDPQIRQRAGENPTWESLNEVFELYAQTMRQRFDEAHKK